MTPQELRVWINETGWCGCGLPEKVWHLLEGMLECLSRHATLEEQRKLISDEGARYWILYDLDRMKLSEHGGSVDGSWLTDKGREVLDALQEEDIDELADEHWCIHGFSVEDANHNCFAPPMGAG